MSSSQPTEKPRTAERIESYAPQLGDLICTGRGRSAHLRFDDLPAGQFQSHCDIVVQTSPESLSVIGGNVDDAVTMKHVPTTPDGKLAGPDGIRHRFGAHRRARTEIRDDRIKAVVGPV